MRYVVQLGTPLALPSRALGRLLLSYEPEADWPAWLGAEPYPAYPRQTLTRFARMRPILRRIRTQATATTLSEQHEGIGSCAVPVPGADGRVACGIATQTLAETYPGFVQDTWTGLFVPAGTPREAIATLHRAIFKVFDDPEIRQMSDENGRQFRTTPEEADAFVKSEVPRWTELLKAAGIEPS